MAKQVITQQDGRMWIQPTNGGEKFFVTHFMVDGLKASDGSASRINMPDPIQRRRYIEQGRTFDAPDIASFSLTIRNLKGGIPKYLSQIKAGIPFNVYVEFGSCGAANNFLTGFEQGHGVIIPNCVRTERDFGSLTAFDKDEAREVKISVQCADPAHFGAISFGEQAGTSITTEVMDVAYSTAFSDGGCGAVNAGDQWAAALVKAVSGAKPSIRYTTNMGSSWTLLSIAVAANDEVVTALAYNDKYIVVCSAADKYYVSTIDAAGVPGAFVAVTTGIVATKNTLDVYFLEANTFIFSGTGGYVYKTINPTDGVTTLTAAGATSSNLTRITASPDGRVWAAGGVDGAFIYSVNEGATWSAPTNAPVASGTNVLSIGVLDEYRFFAGLSTGSLVKTSNKGVSAWTSVSFTGSGGGTVNDIKAVNDQIIFFAHATATPDGRIWASMDGGNEWTNTTPRLSGLPVVDRYNRIAFPRSTELDVRANTLLAGGLNGDGADGILLLGAGVYV